MLGICNGFQVLCEARLLPGALLGNAEPAFHLQPGRARGPLRRRLVHARVRARRALSIPAKHAWGRYYADPADARRDGPLGSVRAALRPGQNFNGSVHDIAGVCNEAGNVFGLMPHPEHAVDELTGGSADGLKIFESMRLTVEGGGPERGDRCRPSRTRSRSG